VVGDVPLGHDDLVEQRPERLVHDREAGELLRLPREAHLAVHREETRHAPPSTANRTTRQLR